MNFYIYTLGCKVNTYESEMMKEKLLSAGYSYHIESPEIIIVNTCSVTNMADHKSLKMIRHFKKNHPNAILIVCGCSAQNNQTVYQAMGIDILLGNRDKSQIVSLIENYLKNKDSYQKFYESRKLPFENMQVDKFTTHTRAFVKIQDGCDNFCSYCIIPFVRGSIRSKSFDESIKEVKTLVKNGHKEIVLTGIHTGSYGTGTEHDLTDLIHEMSKIENLERIRISSIEITELNDKFLKELETNSKICNHLHIPLQAGSDEILEKMNRKYNLEYFEKKLHQIRAIRPDISITTDIIVGHPYETEELFLKTMETAKKFNFSKIHVFPYSKRTGTKAAMMPQQVSEIEKKSRSKRLCLLSKELEKNYYSLFLGKEVEVLMEENNIGCTSNYLKVFVNDNFLPNELIKVKIESFENGVLKGKELTNQK